MELPCHGPMAHKGQQKLLHGCQARAPRYGLEPWPKVPGLTIKNGNHPSTSMEVGNDPRKEVYFPLPCKKFVEGRVSGDLSI